MTLFKLDVDSFCEIEGPDDKVIMSVAIFSLSGSKYHGVVKGHTGELIEADNAMKLTVNRKFYSFMSQEECEDMLFNNEDCNYVTIE